MPHVREILNPFDSPMEVEVVAGEVVALGPEGMAMSLTPQAAKISGSRLIAAAEAAAQAPKETKGD